MSNRKTMRSLFGGVGVLVTIVLTTFALVSTAAAASAPSTAPVAATAGPDAAQGQPRTLTSTPDQAKPAETIVCTPNVQNPHNSSHVHGTVNVVVTLTCTAAVRQINIRAALYFNGHLVKDSGQRTFNNTASARNNAAVPCRSGNYQGWMSFGVLFPPGFVPPTGSGSGFGRAVPITC